MLKVLKDKRFAWIPSTAGAVLVFTLGTFLTPGLINRIENSIHDRAIGYVPPSPNVAIIAIDDESIAHLGAWPWSLTVHAQLLEKLREAGAPVVAFTEPFGATQNAASLTQLRAALDLLKSEELAKSAQGEQLRKLLDNSVADLDQDTTLANAIAHHGGVVLPIEAKPSHELTEQPHEASDRLANVTQESSFVTADPSAIDEPFSATEVRAPQQKFAARARALGHVAIQPDSDDKVRSDIAVLKFGEHFLPSLAVAVVATRQGLEASQVALNDDGVVNIGRKHIQLNAQSQWRPGLTASRGNRAVQQFSYWKVLSGEVPLSDLRDKTVIVGVTYRSAGNTMSLPLRNEATRAQWVAGAVSSIELNRNYRHPAWANALEVLLAVGVIAIAAFLLPSMSLLVALILCALLIVALLGIEVGMLNINGVWLQLSLNALACFAAAIGLCTKLFFKKLRKQRGAGADSIESLRMLGLTFQGQGQLDLAYETFRRCPNDTQSLDLLYGLGQDYERRRQFNKAAEVYTHVTSVDSQYKDSLERRDRMKKADLAQAAAAVKPSARTSDRGNPRADIRGVSKSTSAEPPTIPAPSGQRPPAGKRQSLGRYEIERELGKGAMGVVYLGRDPKINRVVAIKAIALAEEFAEDDLADARARFFREAEMAGRLNHPGIVTVYDAGEDRGLAYIAMEYLRGEHLSHYAEPIRLLPVPRVLGLVARVADALDYAHKQNVVHRDIKPANIMFNKDTDELKITDFGIARLTDTSRTKTGIVLGTPSFMSPEQLEGRPLDGRSDLFALGITLYQLLTGQLPFRADSMTRLMQKIATEEHVPLRSLRPELPEMAEQIVARALAKSAVDRYQTGAEMAAALRTCIRLASRKEAIAR